MRAVVTTLITGVLLVPGISAAKAEWPRIRPIDRTYEVVISTVPVEIDLPVVGLDGRKLYLFSCRGGSEDQLDALGERRHINYVGPFACRLNEGGTENESSLLSEDDSPAWHSRGQFHASQLLGACASYPEFGHVRSFRLRGFKLTLRISNAHIDEGGQLKRLRINVSLSQDKSADGEQAERPGYLMPTKDCRTMQKGSEPRMCRDWKNRDREGSWTEC